jgi:hypothetical protein
VYFLFTLLYIQYTYTYTTTGCVIRDLLLCSTDKLLVMVGSLQFIGADCYLLFIHHYKWLFRLVVLILLFLSVCLVVYFTVDARCPVYVVLQLVDRCWSLCIRVGTFWGCRNCLVLPLGIGVVLVFYSVAGRVSSVRILCLQCCTFRRYWCWLTLQFTAPLLLSSSELPVHCSTAAQ